MCGIAGIFEFGGGRVDRARLARISAHMESRGPDASGDWFSDDGMVGLAHRRLSIIDLSEGGAQPMSDPSGRYAIVFNGEIYNYREIRRDLERTGSTFESESDTEVLLSLIASRGIDGLASVRGMFAFALWDFETRSLLLARDPYGIKPLYFAAGPSGVAVASQVRALLAGGGVDTRPEPAGHVGYFLWGAVPEPYTLFRGVRAVPAGGVIRITPHGVEAPRVLARVRDALSAAQHRPPLLENGAVEGQLREALRESVAHHLVADVDVGVFLSSGLDSTTVTALTAEAGGRLRTVTLGFEEYRGTNHDEAPLAEAVAAHYGADHQTIWINRATFDQHADRFLACMDQPSFDGLNTYFVSHAAAEAGLRVALSGLGGDELFGGYPSFAEVPRVVGTVGRAPLPAAVGRGLRAITSPILGRMTSPKYAGILEYGSDYGGAYLLRRCLYMPWELDAILDPEMVEEGLQELAPRMRLNETVEGIESVRLKVTALESEWYMRNQLLRDSDWASMAHSVEVRVPLVDWHLLRTVAPLLAGPTPVTKQMAARAPERPLPADIFTRPKTGFTTPIRTWSMDRLNGSPQERGLRSWTRLVYERYLAEA
jgi:asparagine synthase (glutamine-hydrolysing)